MNQNSSARDLLWNWKHERKREATDLAPLSPDYLVQLDFPFEIWTEKKDHTQSK
jgi:hypothetical protein